MTTDDPEADDHGGRLLSSVALVLALNVLLLSLVFGLACLVATWVRA
jgi:hypothetical protein